ncbi:unknown [Prevotella sp. CAG:592]|nr:unknown [Prevotella sp. CAG:592]
MVFNSIFNIHYSIFNIQHSLLTAGKLIDPNGSF